jgi:hypothetical protein
MADFQKILMAAENNIKPGTKPEFCSGLKNKI